jgi:hypothetical protein
LARAWALASALSSALALEKVGCDVFFTLKMLGIYRISWWNMVKRLSDDLKICGFVLEIFGTCCHFKT